MKTIQRAIRVMVCGLCGIAAQPAVCDEVQPGFYLGVSAGQSEFDLEKSEFNGVVFDALFSQGAFVTSLSSTLEDSDTALSLFAGYHFNPYIAVEVGYIDLGAAEFRSIATVNPPGPVVSAPASVDVDIETTGFTVSALGSIPLGEVVDIHGHLGFLFGSTDVTATARLGSAVGTGTDNLDSIGGFFGVGAGFHLAEHWSLSVDWTRYANVGDEDEDDDVRTEAGFDVDAVSVSAMFRF